MDFLDKLLRLFGTNKVRLRWRWAALRDAVQRRARSASNRSKALQYEHQLCPSCGHPASKDEKICSRCQTRLQGAVFNRASRALGWLLPQDFPFATATMLAACAALYFVTVKATFAYLGDNAQGFTPINGVLVRYGATEAVLMVRYDEWYRAITAIFLHGSVTHLVFNCYGLWVAGTTCEERFGRTRTVVAFLLTGIAGNLLSIWWRWRGHEYDVPGVGASGSIMGLMGLIIGHAVRYRGRTAAELRARFIPWVLFVLLIGFASRGTDNMAHLGGLLSGGLMGALLADRDQARRAPKWFWSSLALLSLGAIVAAFYFAAQFDPRRIGM